MSMTINPSNERIRPTQEDLAPGYRYIVVAKDYLRGAPAMFGRRITVAELVKMLDGGWKKATLMNEYELSAEAMDEVIRYAREHEELSRGGQKAGGAEPNFIVNQGAPSGTACGQQSTQKAASQSEPDDNG